MTNQTSKELVLLWHLEHQHSREDDIVLLCGLRMDMETLRGFYKILKADNGREHLEWATAITYTGSKLIKKILNKILYLYFRRKTC